MLVTSTSVDFLTVMHLESSSFPLGLEIGLDFGYKDFLTSATELAGLEDFPDFES